MPINLVSFFFLSLLSFRRNAAYLFYGLDGRYEANLIELNSLFVPPLLGYTNDFIHGLGNVWFAVNPWFLPGYLLSLSGPGQFTNFPLVYAICASELFLGTYLAARLIGVPALIALIGAWLLPLLTFQYVGWHLVPSTFRAFPHYATVASVSTLVTAAFLLIGRLPIRKAIITTALCFIGITFIVVVSPTLLILAAPQFAIAGLICVAAANGQPTSRIFRFALLGAIPLACLLIGHAHFVMGLAANSVTTFFPNLSIRPGDLKEASLLFWNPYPWGIFTVERTFIVLGLAGGLWSAVRASGTLHLASIAFLLAAALYLAVGITHAYHPFWFGPAVWYFEGFLSPFHSIFTAFLLTEVVRTAGRIAAQWHFPARPFPAPVVATAVALAIAVCPWVYIHARQKAAGPPNLPLYIAQRQPETPITRVLKDEVALAPGAPFRGRVATLTGRSFPLSTNVDFVGLSAVPDFLAMFATGNLHNFMGLWQDSIPTLVEYSPLMTPAYFAFGRTFFTEPADRQIRNVLAMRRIDPRTLASVGIRFFITDAPFPGPARIRQTIPVNVTADMVARMGVREPISSFSLYLYELENVNLGQYSPIKVVKVARASEMLRLLGDAALDLSQVAFAAEDVTQPLSPATLGEFRVERGRFHVKASSGGWSILILPLEFSRCMDLQAVGAETGDIRLLRVNLLLTGIVFQKDLDARLTYHTGPFVHSRCRLQDARDMDAIDMRNAFEHRPELAPIPLTRY